jgi:carbonic anhydrase
MDGRIQKPLLNWLTSQYDYKWVDSITEPGACKVLAEQSEPAKLESILRRVALSIKVHDTTLIAVSGHHDCLANPVCRTTQAQQLETAVDLLRSEFPNREILPVYVNHDWEVEKL